MKTLNLTNSKILTKVKEFNTINGSTFSIDFATDNKRCYLFGGFSKFNYLHGGQKFNRNTVLDYLESLNKETIIGVENEAIYEIAKEDTEVTNDDGDVYIIEKGDDILKEFKTTSEFKILMKYSSCETNSMPQNAGLYQLIINFSKNNYSNSIHLHTKEAVLDFIQRNERGSIFKILETKNGKAIKWEWIKYSNIEQVQEIFNQNEQLLKTAV
jgi:hypothetical protein